MQFLGAPDSKLEIIGICSRSRSSRLIRWWGFSALLTDGSFQLCIPRPALPPALPSPNLAYLSLSLQILLSYSAVGVGSISLYPVAYAINLPSATLTLPTAICHRVGLLKPVLFLSAAWAFSAHLVLR